MSEAWARPYHNDYRDRRDSHQGDLAVSDTDRAERALERLDKNITSLEADVDAARARQNEFPKDSDEHISHGYTVRGPGRSLRILAGEA